MPTADTPQKRGRGDKTVTTYIYYILSSEIYCANLANYSQGGHWYTAGGGEGDIVC